MFDVIDVFVVFDVVDCNLVQVLTTDGVALCVLDPTVLGLAPLGDALLGVAVCADTDEIFVTDRCGVVVGMTWTHSPVRAPCMSWCPESGDLSTPVYWQT